MTRHSWRVMRVFGIDIRIDPSWLIVATLISYSLFLGLNALYPAVGTAAAVAISLFGTALFFGSVLFHELTHALVARRRGFRIKDITLFLFGGATQANIESKGAFDEFIVSVVGPLSSFGLAIFFGVARSFSPSVADGALPGILGYLAWANLLLGVFNFLPGLPLDGGRVLQSILWRSTGNFDRSTKIASIAGEVIGYGLIGIGAIFFFGGAFFQGIWFAAIGWFLAESARASYTGMRVRHALEHVQAAEIMEAHPVRVPAGATIAEAAHHYLLRHDHDAFVIEDGGRIVGVVTLESARIVPRDEWSRRSVVEVMIPVTRDTIVDPHTPMVSLLDRFEGLPYSIPVGDPDHVVGVISGWDLTMWLRRRRALAA